MGTVTIASDMASVLGQLKERTEIRDAQGKLLGVFTPQAVAEEERLKMLFDLEEAERVLKEEYDAGRPLKEFWEELRAKAASK